MGDFLRFSLSCVKILPCEQVLGAVILGFGIWILVDKTSFIAVLHNSSSSLKIGSYILIAVGGFTMIMGFMGCIGAVNEVRCLLGLYFTFLLVILLAQIAAGVLIYLNRGTLKTEMSDIIHELIVTYNPNDSMNVSAEVTWDYIQNTLQCCGWVNYQNWTENEIVANHTDLYPCSCVKNDTQTEGFCNSNTANLHPVGCMQQVESWLQDNLGIILGVCIGVVVTELIGLVLSICLCRNIHNEDYTKVPKY
ncbi:CD82 antigen isoform X2 [Rhinoderma darwinii]|uniref:CD82 antigen isoform X2 n=1 Tax=Rhinoderma darwinii TaxID=43563 RepID=UPI003F67E1C1